MTFDIVAKKRAGDQGLTNNEELSHQFQMAKLMQHNFVALSSDDESEQLNVESARLETTDHIQEEPFQVATLGLRFN